MSDVLSLGHPVIDTGVRIQHLAPDLEDYVASYGGVALVDELRAAQALRRGRGLPRDGSSDYWRELFCERQAERGCDHSVVVPDDALVTVAVADPGRRQALQRALNHYHADRWHRHRARVTPVAGVPLETPREAIGQLEFAVKRLGYKVVAVASPRRLMPPRWPDFDPFWDTVRALGVPVLVDSVAPGSVPHPPSGLAVGFLDRDGGEAHRHATEGALFVAAGAPAGAAPRGMAPIYASDLGGPGLLETWRQVERGAIAEDDFRGWVFGHPHRLFAGAAPRFFEGTSLAGRRPVTHGPVPAAVAA